MTASAVIVRESVNVYYCQLKILNESAMEINKFKGNV